MESHATLIKGISENSGGEFYKTKREQGIVKALILIKAGKNNEEWKKCQEAG